MSYDAERLADKTWDKALLELRGPNFNSGLCTMLGWFTPQYGDYFTDKNWYGYHYQKMVGDALRLAQEVLDDTR